MGSDILDLLVVITLCLFTIDGYKSGFIQEIAGLFALFAGFWAARAWNMEVAPYLTFISDPGFRPVAACIIIFIAVMLAVGVLARIAKKIVAFSFGAWIDRLAGLVLGLGKGILIWCLVFIVLEKFFPSAQFLRGSRTYPYFETLINQIATYLPPEIASRI